MLHTLLLLLASLTSAAHQDFDEDAPPPGFEGVQVPQAGGYDPYGFARMSGGPYYYPPMMYQGGYVPLSPPQYQMPSYPGQGQRISLDELFAMAPSPQTATPVPQTEKQVPQTASAGSSSTSSASKFEFKSKEEVQQSKRGRKITNPKPRVLKTITVEDLLADLPAKALEKPLVPGLEHVVDLLDPQEYQLVADGVDPRDIAYAYLLVGERAFSNLLCLMANYWQVGALLRHSVDDFQKDMEARYESDPDFFQAMTSKCTGASAEEFFAAIEMYRRRLRFAHPKKFLGQKTPQDPARRRHLKYFYTAPSSVGFKVKPAAVKSVKSKSKVDLKDVQDVPDRPLLASQSRPRPASLTAVRTVDVVLAVLYLQDHYPTEPLDALRKGLAHYQGNDQIYQAYVAYIFAEHPHRQFLAGLKNIDLLTL